MSGYECQEMEVYRGRGDEIRVEDCFFVIYAHKGHVKVHAGLDTLPIQEGRLKVERTKNDTYVLFKRKACRFSNLTPSFEDALREGQRVEHAALLEAIRCTEELEDARAAVRRIQRAAESVEQRASQNH